MLVFGLITICQEMKLIQQEFQGSKRRGSPSDDVFAVVQLVSVTTDVSRQLSSPDDEARTSN